MGGWVLAYIFRFVIFITDGIPTDAAASFGKFISNPWEPLVWSTIFLALSLAVIYRGVEKGIERFSKIMMPLLFVLLLTMIVRSLTLPGSWEGVTFLLYPDWSKLSLSGAMDAMGQMFWSISLGMGIIITYGSYMRKKTNMVTAGFTIPILDTIAAIMAGLCILPAVFAFGVEPTQGPSLTFVTLPLIFGKMPLGVLFGIVFFILLFAAAITSNISLLEVGVSYLIDTRKMHRRRAVFAVGIFTLIVSIPCSLSLGILDKTAVLGGLGLQVAPFNLNFFDFCDYITQNIFMIVAGLFTCVFVGHSWKVANALEEITNNGEHPMPAAWLWSFLIKYVSPLFMLIVLLRSLSII